MIAKPEGNPFAELSAKSERAEVPWETIKKENLKSGTLSMLLNRVP
jgi:hypothetical protein